MSEGAARKKKEGQTERRRRIGRKMGRCRQRLTVGWMGMEVSDAGKGEAREKTGAANAREEVVG